jgi:glutamate racemase
LLTNGDAQPAHRFASSGDPELFARLGVRFLGPELQRVEFLSMDGEPAPLGR